MLIFIDGCCQGNFFGVNYCDDFGLQDLNWLLLDMIECIEVVCGLMFLLYGFDVMGGVINIIICKIVFEWGGLVIYNYSVLDLFI